MQLLALGTAVAVLLYAVGRMLVHEPPPADTAALATSDPAVKPGAGAGGIGAARAAGPGGIAPTLKNEPLATGYRLPPVAELPRLSRGTSAPPLSAEELIGQFADIEQGYASAPKDNDLAIRRILRQLGALGDGAVPAIRDFLSTGEDLAFELVSVDGRLVDSKSLRLAMLDMLGAMGGAEATGVLVDELLSTGSPREIQAIARLLDKQYPGEYRKLALDATSDILGRMSRGELDKADAAPLFHLLAEFGDAEAIAQLEKPDGSSPLYRAVALAEAPDGTGIAGLIRLWQQAGDPSLQQIATQLLAQSAPRYPQAAQALVDGLGANKIAVPDHLWPKIGQALTGHYDLQLLKPDVGPLPAELTRSPYRHMNLGGSEGSSTVYITHVENLSPEETRARLAVVEQLLRQDLGPAATSALEQARTALMR